MPFEFSGEKPLPGLGFRRLTVEAPEFRGQPSPGFVFVSAGDVDGGRRDRSIGQIQRQRITLLRSRCVMVIDR